MEKAYVRRTRTRANYDPYPHEDTHVYLPDGSHHLVEKTAPGRTAKEYNEEVVALIQPWEKDSIMAQDQLQKTPGWAAAYPSKTKPLDKGGLRERRSNVAADKVRNWDSFEISFDPNAVDTEEKRKAIFDEVVEWAKTVHTEGLEGGRRAFTIQNWHGLNNSSMRPHLRVELHRVGWVPDPQLPKLDVNGPKPILVGKVQSRMNYSNAESGETDKDFQPLREELRKYHIDMETQGPTQGQHSAAVAQAVAVPPTPQAIDVLLQQIDRPAVPTRAEVSLDVPEAGQAQEALPRPASGVGNYELRPHDPLSKEVEESLRELEAAQQRHAAAKRSFLLTAQNDQLKAAVESQGATIQDLNTHLSRKDELIAQKDEAYSKLQDFMGKRWKRIKTKFKSFYDGVMDKLRVETERRVAAEQTVEVQADTLKTQEVALQAGEAKVAQLTEEVRTERGLRSTAEQTVQTQAVALQASESKVTSLTEDKTSLEAQIKVLRENLTQAGAERDAHKALAQDLQARNEMLVGKTMGLERDVSEIQAKNTQLVQENAGLAQTVASTTRENRDLQEEVGVVLSRHKAVLKYAEEDSQVITKKASMLEENHNQLHTHLQQQGDLDGLTILNETKGRVTPIYRSRLVAYLEAGQPIDPKEPAFLALQDDIRKINIADGAEVISEAKSRTIEAEKAGLSLGKVAEKALPDPASTEPQTPNPVPGPRPRSTGVDVAKGAETPVIGPRPNPRATRGYDER